VRVVLVTGATSGIGRATALAFAALGDSVIVAGRNIERGKAVVRECSAVGGEAVFLEADVTAPTAPAEMVALARSRYGRLDVACNNAGWQEPRRPLADQPAEVYARVFDTNVGAVVRAMSAQLHCMVEQRSGVIVNVGSASASRNPNVGLALYSASKAALASFTRSAAMEYGPLGVRVNLVTPGRIVTPMMTGAGIADSAAIAAALPARRMGDPEDVARAITWIASPDASFVLGADLRVDGGFGAT
jgi:NAD(P)-dependent dehydrogenase (short-subunit alcohol dehydrogenase family)